MNENGQVELSAITVSPGGLTEIEPTLAALRAQSASDRIELVVIAREPIPDDAPELSGFAAVKTVSFEFTTLGSAIARGMREASGPVAAYSEEHSRPEPGWAEALIERFRGPWAAVGWCVQNANPGTAASWAHLLTDFGPGVAPVEAGERHGPMPWHHVAYRRDALPLESDQLTDLFESEGMLQELILEQGGRLYFDNSVASSHLNISRLRDNMRSHLFGGRGYGSGRRRLNDWGRGRRLVYALGFPLVPVIRYRRMQADLRRTRGVRGRIPGLHPQLLLNLFVDALGEAIGYVWGEGRSREQRLPMELRRRSYLRDGDAELPAPPTPRPPAGSISSR